MRFLIVSEGQVAAGRVTFTDDQQRYLAKVLRQRAGDALEVVVAGRGEALAGRLEPAPRNALALAVESTRALPPPPRPALTLAVGLIKQPRLELVVRLATELGVARLALLSAERAVVDWSERGRETRLADIAISACQQSGNPYPPAIERPVPVAAFVDAERARSTLVIAVAEGGNALANLTVPRADLALLIGPEGDFTPAERTAAEDAGAFPLTLSGHVLRAESAAVVLGTLFLDRLGRL